MKNKGFTLIELLAVIVVLAVIALIATPIVLNLVEKSRVGAAEQSATAYVKAVENGIMAKLIKDPSATVKGTFTVNADGTKIVNSSGTEIDVDVKGNKPAQGGTIVIGENGSVETANLEIKNYIVSYKDGKSEVRDFEKPLTQENYENGANAFLAALQAHLATIENINEYTNISGYSPMGGVESKFYELHIGDDSYLPLGGAFWVYNLYAPQEYSFVLENGVIKDGAIIFCDTFYCSSGLNKVMLVKDGQLDKTVYTNIHADATQADKELMVNDLIDALETHLSTDANVNSYTKIKGSTIRNYNHSSYAQRAVTLANATNESVGGVGYPKLSLFTFDGHKSTFDFFTFTMENGKVKDGEVSLSYGYEKIQISNGQIVK